MPQLYKLAFHRTKTVFSKIAAVCFYQVSICFSKIEHRISLFQENQVPVRNPMQLQLRREIYPRTFGDLFGLVRILCLFFELASDLQC